MVIPTVILAYFTAWSIYGRNYFVADILADRITHINYAFANINASGQITLGDSYADVDRFFPNDTDSQPLKGNFNQLTILKQKYPHLRTLISVGGWTWSCKFSDVALTDKSRSTFAASCVEFLKKYNFDGIDVDWEYPVSGGMDPNTSRPVDKQNYVLLLKELRRQLDAVTDKKYLLTAATPAANPTLSNFDLPGMAKYLDWFNVMTYDFHGSWDEKTGHNSPLYKNNDETISDIPPYYAKSTFNCHAAIRAYRNGGVAREKLVIGIPLYGRGWQGVTSTVMNGFSQPASSQPPPGTWDVGVFDYDDLKKSYISPLTRYWDDQSKVPFMFNVSSGIWISYDDITSVTFKSDYVKEQQLRGIFFWELSSDRKAELITTAYRILDRISQSTGSSAPAWMLYHRYAINDQVTFQGKIYKCIQAHISYDYWIPPLVPALWSLIAY